MTQTDHLDPCFDKRNQKGRSRDRRGDGPSLDLAPSGAFRGGKQQGAAIQSDVACARDKSEERIGAYAGDGEVRKLQFGPGIAAGFESPIALDDIARDGSRGSRQERNLIDRLGDFGPLEGFRTQDGRMRDT